MKILHIISTLSPTSGGPAQTINNITGEFSQREGVSIEVVSLDSPNASWMQNINYRIYPLGPSFGKYGFNFKLIPWLKKYADDYDAIFIHGLWQFIGLAAWSTLRNKKKSYFIFPHGMLDPWFKETYFLKHIKKWFYWLIVEHRVLRDAQKVLFTSDIESQDAPKSFSLYKVNGYVISYGVSPPPRNTKPLRNLFFLSYPKLKGKRIFLFLGRIHRKKGCDLLIEAFAEIAKQDSSFHLVMAGPDKEGMTKKLKKEALDLNVAHQITWTGILTGDIRWGAYYASEVFCLPSHQENFGLSVVEALGCGKPVLISNKINIWNKIKLEGAGLVDSDSLDGTLRNFKAWLSMPENDKRRMQAKALPCFNKHFTIEKLCDEIIKLAQP